MWMHCTLQHDVTQHYCFVFKQRQDVSVNMCDVIYRSFMSKRDLNRLHLYAERRVLNFLYFRAVFTLWLFPVLFATNSGNKNSLCTTDTLYRSKWCLIKFAFFKWACVPISIKSLHLLVFRWRIIPVSIITSPFSCCFRWLLPHMSEAFWDQIFCVIFVSTKITSVQISVLFFPLL
jgi:hypothetical protein